MDQNEIKGIIKKIGNLFTVLAVGFIANRLYTYRHQIYHVWNDQVIIMVIFSTVVCSVLIIVSAKVFYYLVASVAGHEIRQDLVIPIYVKSNLYKYLPGNIMHYVGRNQIAVETEASHGQVALCTVTEMMAACIGGLLAGLLFSYSYVQEWLIGNKFILKKGLIFIIIAIVAAIILGIVIFRKSNIKEKCLHIIKGVNPLFLVGFVLYYFLNQITQGLMFMKLLQSMGVVLAPKYSLSVIGVYAFSWLIGFVVPGAPGGLGVREAMLSVFLGSVVSPDMLSAAVVINRIITIFGDILAFIVVNLYMQIMKREVL